MLKGRELTCVRDGRRLFSGLSFGVGAGQLLHVEGANGAGKTSLMRILCGLLPATSGEVYWRGQAITQNRPDYYAELLYLGHIPGLKEDLTAQENLRFYRHLSGERSTPALHDAIDAALDAVGLYGFEDVPIRALSAGQKRRVALARLWLSPTAPLWLLDEPLTALDSAATAKLTDRLRQHSEAGGCAVLTSHQPLTIASGRLQLG